MTTEIVKPETSIDRNRLIEIALDKNADPTVLTRLMDLRERWDAQNSRKEYVLAMTAFKQDAPAVLIKSDKVDFTSKAGGRTNYNYANLGSIVQEISALLGKHELSASWQTSQNEKGICVTCNITHSAGHRESVTLQGPADISGNKNAIQAIGSTVTYLQRYTLLAALGLATGEDDDRGGKDNHTTGKPTVNMPQAKTPITPQQAAEAVEGEIVSDTDKEFDKPSVLDYIVEAVNKSSKTKDGKPYSVVINGDKYGTFSDTLATIAKENIGKPVVIEFETKGKFKNLLQINPFVEQREPGDETAEEAGFNPAKD